MTLREFLVIIDLSQPYEIWFEGNTVVQETSDLRRMVDFGGPSDTDLVELNLDSEIKKIYTRTFCWNKDNEHRASILVDMKDWRTK